MSSVNAVLFEREQEPDFFAKKCRYCGEPERRCECGDELRDRARDEASTDSGVSR